MVITDLVAGYGYTTSMYGVGTPTAFPERCLRVAQAILCERARKCIICCCTETLKISVV